MEWWLLTREVTQTMLCFVIVPQCSLISDSSRLHMFLLVRNTTFIIVYNN